MNKLPSIYLDIDNTLVTPFSQISEVNKAAIKAYINAGGKVHLLTGKVPYAMKDLVNELELNHLSHAGANGGILLQDNQEILVASLNQDARNIVAYLRNNNIPYFVYYTDKTTYAHDNPVQAHIDKIEALNEPPVSYEAEHNYDKLIKVLVYKEKDEAFEQVINEVIKDLNEVELVKTAHDLYEFLNIKMRKSYALNHINEDTLSIAVGDSQNDLSMLEVCDKAYVVANASDELKALGFDILPSCNENGVAYLIAQLLEDEDLYHA